MTKALAYYTEVFTIKVQSLIVLLPGVVLIGACAIEWKKLSLKDVIKISKKKTEVNKHLNLNNFFATFSFQEPMAVAELKPLTSGR